MWHEKNNFIHWQHLGASNSPLPPIRTYPISLLSYTFLGRLLTGCNFFVQNLAFLFLLSNNQTEKKPQSNISEATNVMEPTRKFCVSGVREETCAAFFVTQHFGFCERCLPQLTSQETCLLRTNITQWHLITHPLDLKQARESSENALALWQTNFGWIHSSPTESWTKKIEKYKWQYLRWEHILHNLRYALLKYEKSNLNGTCIGSKLCPHMVPFAQVISLAPLTN